jgi:hypothetical protein
VNAFFESDEATGKDFDIQTDEDRKAFAEYMVGDLRFLYSSASGKDPKVRLTETTVSILLIAFRPSVDSSALNSSSRPTAHTS